MHDIVSVILKPEQLIIDLSGFLSDLCCIVLHRAASCCIVLHRAASCCIVLHRAASCCIVKDCFPRCVIFAFVNNQNVLYIKE
jgi:hypothetical protein